MLLLPGDHCYCNYHWYGVRWTVDHCIHCTIFDTDASRHPVIKHISPMQSILCQSAVKAKHNAKLRSPTSAPRSWRTCSCIDCYIRHAACTQYTTESCIGSDKEAKREIQDTRKTAKVDYHAHEPRYTVALGVLAKVHCSSNPAPFDTETWHVVLNNLWPTSHVTSCRLFLFNEASWKESHVDKNW